jgi:hypothetical protein
MNAEEGAISPIRRPASGVQRISFVIVADKTTVICGDESRIAASVKLLLEAPSSGSQLRLS